MHMSSAKNKPIRPFSPQFIQPKDSLFTHWNNQETPLSVEIGCGAGLHPIQWAKLNPDKRLVAIERTKEKFQAFEQRLKNNSIHNVYGVNDDALNWLPANIKANSVENYYILYPNPYPKEKQANKRFHRSCLFHYILETLKPSGQVHMATNEISLFNEALYYFKDFWRMELLEQGPILSNQRTPRTHFEKKYLNRGETCFNLVTRKR